MLRLEKFHKALVLVTVGAVVCVLVWYQLGRSSADDHADAVRCGTPIVRAIRAFRTANGQLPNTLDELVPAYINRIDVPKYYACPWVYSRYFARDEFVLWIRCEPATGFEGPSYTVFDSGEAEEWQFKPGM